MAVPNDSDNVKVAVRCRPMNEKEVSMDYKQCIQVDEIRKTVTVDNPKARGDGPPKMFTFDTVFGPESKQTDVYNTTARPIVESVIEGYNGTVFAYGQTGTGKTFTMEGVRTVGELRGIIPNSFAHIFGHIAKMGGDVRFLVRVSYLEIYNENVRDLLGKHQKANLEVKERPDVGVYVKDLSAYVVNNADDMDKTMTMGNKNRAVSATKMNEQSSRSHAIFTITIEKSEKGPDGLQHLRMGKLHMVDLAGSERQSKTGATGDRLREANKINLSLATLGNVISALVDGKSTHIPYRNSKLTRLLQDSLGGNSKTVMIANVGPALYNLDETISTLRYANNAKKIKNNAKINEDPKDALLRQFQNEIEKLRAQLQDGADFSGSEDEDEYVDELDEEGKTVRIRKPKTGHHVMSAEEVQQMQAQIDAEKKALKAKAGLAVDERNKVAAALEKREKELMRQKEEQSKLQEKLQAIQSKLIVGGVNLLEKAAEQEKLLEASAREIQARQAKENELRKKIEEKEAEKVDIEEKYVNLKEEAVGKTKKLKKVWKMLMSTKSEVEDMREDHQRETENILESIRMATKELKRVQLIVDAAIPGEFQDLISHNAVWNDDIGEWQLRHIAYTGNNMRKRSPTPERKQQDTDEVDLSNVYLTYYPGASMESARSMRPKTATNRAKSSRPKTASKKKEKTDKMISAASERNDENQYPESRSSTSMRRHHFFT